MPSEGITGHNGKQDEYVALSFRLVRNATRRQETEVEKLKTMIVSHGLQKGILEGFLGKELSLLRDKQAVPRW